MLPIVLGRRDEAAILDRTKTQLRKLTTCYACRSAHVRILDAVEGRVRCLDCRLTQHVRWRMVRDGRVAAVAHAGRTGCPDCPRCDAGPMSPPPDPESLGLTYRCLSCHYSQRAAFAILIGRSRRLETVADITPADAQADRQCPPDAYVSAFLKHHPGTRSTSVVEAYEFTAEPIARIAEAA